MKCSHWNQLVAGCIGLLLCAFVQAQTTYRCGKVFQDRPCDGNQQINSPATSPGGAQGASRLSADPACARRGEEAQKIVWTKEAGRTEEMQLAAATNSEQKRLISEVYRRRGTSSEMRAAIESDCNADRDRAAQAAALIDAGRLLQQQGAPPASTLVPTGPSEAQQEKAKRDALAAADADKQSRCKSLASRLTSIRDRQRAGLSGGEMDRMNQEYRDTETSRRALNC